MGLPNIIMDKEVVPEYLQEQMNSKNIAKSLHKMLSDESYKQQIVDNYEELSQTLGKGGASKQTAALISQYLTT